ncbi:hypothetical protein P175DRAFT_0454877 [Aspergillus ochraceoroseus IBT 24754]|uniref:FRG1-like family protein n=2 Tax=Aspergillus ochraceoroseus TaxID=138278 RepID=A0A2T5M426_9EURO|nr:uncharacterized protein P175DRAFT_0454877 [Aspergillus ochraceoroseus IBT 24754]PTU23291.1 hypothetical protein P175DRAFT_0454877 [Aspergillus ochraceoroseus IBT 24754]
MVKPLTFKGDKPKKRKHREYLTDSVASTTTTPSKLSKPAPAPDDIEAENNAEDQSWVSADSPSDISGPIVIVLPSEPVTCIASDMNGKVFASEVENLIDDDPRSAEPHDVRQVWVATRVAGTEGFSLKGHHGRYLSCDKYGIFGATASAISHHESFLVLPSPDIPGAFFIQTVGGAGESETFISVQDVSGSGGGGDGSSKSKSKSTATATASGAGVEIRGDETNLSFQTTMRIRMQARFKPRIKASKETKAREKISRKELEEVVGRRLEDHEVKRLRRARREGNFHEEVLDVRVKGKHDKFA